MEKAILIRTDGSEEKLCPKDGKKFSLKELQGFVKGYIELAITKDNKDMYVNEEGKINGSIPNEKATKIYKYNQDDVIYGDVVVIEKK